MARLIDSITGHSNKIGLLVSAFQNDELPPQLVFYGPSGIGKKKLAHAFAQVILCQHKTACGQCPSCVKVALGNNESLMIVEPEKNLIKIEKTREILEFLSLKAWNKNRVIIIEDAHTLNPQASNALLKIFEEPPENTYFILITHRPRLLLTTIRSRSKLIGFQPLSIDDLKKSINSSCDDWILKSSRGSLETLTLLKNPESSAIRLEAVSNLLEFLNNPDHFFTTNWREHFKNRDYVSQIINWWMVFIRDSLVPQQFVFSKDQEILLQTLQQFPSQQRMIFFQKLQLSDRGLWSYQDPVLIIENLLISSFYNS